MSLSKTFYPLLSTIGSAQEESSQHDLKIGDWDVKNQNKQTKANSMDPDQNASTLRVHTVFTLIKIGLSAYEYMVCEQQTIGWSAPLLFAFWKVYLNLLRAKF